MNKEPETRDPETRDPETRDHGFVRKKVAIYVR